jgi:hypothetical protein
VRDGTLTADRRRTEGINVPDQAPLFCYGRLENAFSTIRFHEESGGQR